MIETGVDDWLRQVLAGQPPVPRRYVLRCHPDVYLALRRAAAERAPEWAPLAEPAPTGMYGTAAIEMDVALGSGGWELCADGEVLNRGRLGSALQDGDQPGQAPGGQAAGQ